MLLAAATVGQREREAGPFPLEFRPRAPTQRFDRLPDDVQAETRSVDDSHGFVRAEKPLEQPLPLRVRYPESIVPHPHDQFTAPLGVTVHYGFHGGPAVRLPRVTVLDRV